MAGVPRPLIPAVRAVQSDGSLDALAAYLPPECRDVLFGIAAGMRLDEAMEQMLGATRRDIEGVRPDGTGDFSRIHVAPGVDLVLIEGKSELREVLEALESPLDEWRVFLHPHQRKLVRWDVKGPMCMTGSAGTGKTVALMHRAVHLARRLEEPAERILVTTFTTNLSVTIKHQLRQLAGELAERIDVTNLHFLARTICERRGWKGRVVVEHELDEAWAAVWSAPEVGDLPRPKEELRREYEEVIDANGIDHEDDYLTAVRSGRPPMKRAQRRQAWPVFRAFQRHLKRRGLLTPEGAVHEARLAAEEGRFSRYAHILVDEVQDFSLEGLRLIRAMSPLQEGRNNPLCLAGDGHQRIYRKRVPLSWAGIEVRGRSRRLKINYRTSEEIRKFGQSILAGLEIDDLDEGETSTVGDHSLFSGPEPAIEKCADAEAEARAIVGWIDTLTKQHGLGTHEICVTPYKAGIRMALSDAGFRTLELKPRQEDPGQDEPGIRLGSMKRIKGLEFRAMALACAAPEDPMNSLAEADRLARCERYVAATRAREHLLVATSALRE